MRLSTSNCVRWSIGFLALLGSGRLGAEEPGSAAGSVLRVARSNDGLRFTTDAEAFAVGSSSPGVARLEGGELVAVFDARGKGSDGRTVLSIRRSKDDGRTWSPVEAIEMDGSALRGRAARGGELVVEEGGALRLYFSAIAPPSTKGKAKRTAVIRSATGKDGRSFKLDSTVAFRCRGMGEPRACVVRDGERRVMFVADESAVAAKWAESFELVRAVSRDGRTFASTAPVQLASNLRITSVVAVDKGFRGYGWSDDGIVSLRSDDLKEWEVEKGTRLTEAWDPAVVRLKSGTYLMIYVAGGRVPQPEPTVADAADGADVVALVEDFEGEFEDDESRVDGLAPQPDFAEPVDYSKWYRENALEKTDDNAFDAYMEFMPRFDEEGVPDREWPEFEDMFNGGEHEGPPEPWKPDDHPDWEETHQNAKHVLAKFREANQRTGYAMRVDPTPDSNPLGPEEERLLINLRLPHLSSHRELAKATLADSWRVGGDGKVDANQMLDAWKTVLRGAEHFQRGSTLIENLVGISEQQMVQMNARQALKQGVLSGKKLEEALDLLRQYDRDSTDVGRYLWLEHAVALDITQYLFSPPDDEGNPVINSERVDRMKELWGGEASADWDAVKRMSPDSARRTISSFTHYYREIQELMSIGYPSVSASDINSRAAAYDSASPLTNMFLPSLGRVHTLRARSEASRRATQLSYAVHIQHARTGQWPKSLDDLAGEFGNDIRTDPFTGRPFGYRVGKDGPTIYSASENGVDDNGLHRPRWGDGEEDDPASDDFVFWPPQP